MGYDASWEWAPAALEVLAAAILVCALVPLFPRRRQDFLRVYRLQAAMLGAAGFAQYLATSAQGPLWVGCTAILFKAAIVPVVLRTVLAGQDRGRADGRGLLVPIVAVAVAVAAYMVVFAATGTLDENSGPMFAVSRSSLACACAAILLGVLNVALGREPSIQAVGMLSVENGAALALISVRDMPLAPEMAVVSAAATGLVAAMLRWHPGGGRTEPSLNGEPRS